MTEEAGVRNTEREVWKEKTASHSPMTAHQIDGQEFEPFLYLSLQPLHLAPVSYFQVCFKLFQMGIAVLTDLCVETASYRDECNAALYLGQKMKRDWYGFAQCHRGIDVFAGHGGSLQNGCY